MIVAGIDNPAGNGEQFGSVLRLLGWAFAAPSPVSRVEVYLDGRFLALLQTIVPRADVRAVHPAAPLRTGFAMSLDLADLPAGTHELRVLVFDTADACVAFGRTFACAERRDGRQSDAGPPTVLAFYLPQDHPAALDGASAGRGSTEWTNVAAARPFFKHQYQPHLPAELGFYDQRVAQTRAEQARLAAEHGIGGFVYVYSRLGGTHAPDHPLGEVIASNEPRFPFCVCLANENEVRAWDDGIALEQRDSPEDEAAFIRDLIPVLRDERYIRIGGRPLVLVYRPTRFSNVRRAAELWREVCIAEGVGDPFLAYVQRFVTDDPAEFGFDAAVEFPPFHLPLVNAARPVEELAIGFTGRIDDYEALREAASRRPDPPYTLFRGVMPSWDGTPRGGAVAPSFVNAAPEGYGAWLDDACRWTVQHHAPSSHFVFVNAWNDWGRGCHLEPDQRYGRLFLEAGRDATARYASVNAIARPHPLASIIVPCYNHERYVAGALGSALDQSVGALEVIAIDDGSRDGTLAAMNRFAGERGDDRLRMYAQANRGATATLHLGLSRARGEYIAFLNSDDAFAPERLEVMIGALERERADFAFSRVSYIDGDGRDVAHAPGRPTDYLQRQLEREAYPELAYALVDFNLTISTGNFVFRRSLHDRIGGFRPLLWCHDWDFALRALRKGSVTYVDRALYYYRFHGENSWNAYEHLGDFDGMFLREEFFSDHAFVRSLYERDPAYFLRFVRDRRLERLGALDTLAPDEAKAAS